MNFRRKNAFKNACKAVMVAIWSFTALPVHKHGFARAQTRLCPCTNLIHQLLRHISFKHCLPDLISKNRNISYCFKLDLPGYVINYSNYSASKKQLIDICFDMAD